MTSRTIPIAQPELAFLAGRVLLAKQLLDDAKGSATPVFQDVRGLRRLENRLREELDSAVHAWLSGAGHLSSEDTDIQLSIEFSPDGVLTMAATLRTRARRG